MALEPSAFFAPPDGESVYLRKGTSASATASALPTASVSTSLKARPLSSNAMRQWRQRARHNCRIIAYTFSTGLEGAQDKAEVSVIGGTGSSGITLCRELLRQGASGHGADAPGRRPSLTFPPEVKLLPGNLDTLDGNDLRNCRSPSSSWCLPPAWMSAANPKAMPWRSSARPMSFPAKTARAAQQTNIRHAVLLSSIFLQVHHASS